MKPKKKLVFLITIITNLNFKNKIKCKNLHKLILIIIINIMILIINNPDIIKKAI